MIATEQQCERTANTSTTLDSTRVRVRGSASKRYHGVSHTVDGFLREQIWTYQRQRGIRFREKHSIGAAAGPDISNSKYIALN